MKLKIKTKNSNQPICFKNKNEHVGAGLVPAHNRGITLVALIITIIVLLILAVVAITSISNSNIIKHAQNARKNYTEADEKEKVALAIHEALLEGQGTVTENGITNGMNSIFTSNGWKKISSNSETMTVQITESGRQYKITLKTGAIDVITDSGNGGNPSDIPEDFEKYIMGQDKKGRELIGTNGIMDDSDYTFLDDPLTTDTDETQTLHVEFLVEGYNKNMTKLFYYVKYDDKAYKIITNYETYKSEKLELIYEPKGKEGQKTADGWTILYDNGATAEAVSPTAMGNLRLGYSEGTTESETQLTEAIDSYNNAITIINNYCKTLDGLPTNSGIRSVGAKSETTTTKYSSTNLLNWNSKYNEVGLNGDTNYEQDLVRMAYWKVHNVQEPYWIASRSIFEDPDSIFFTVYGMYNNGTVNIDDELWNISGDGTAAGKSLSWRVRPIITINNQ